MHDQVALTFEGNTYARAVHLSTGHNAIKLYGDEVRGMGNFTLGLYKAWDGVAVPVLNNDGNPIVSDFGGAEPTEWGWGLVKTWEFMIPEEGNKGEHYMVPLGMCGNDQCKDCAEQFVDQYACDAGMIENEMSFLISQDWQTGDDIKDIYSWSETTKDVYTCDVCSDCLIDGGLTSLANGDCSTTFTMSPTDAPTAAPTEAPTDQPTAYVCPTCETYSVEVQGGTYPSEISWSLTDSTNNEVTGTVTWYDMSGPDYGPKTFDVSMVAGEQYTLQMFDSYGDGWNGGSWTLSGSDNTLYTGPMTLSSGSNDHADFILTAATTGSSTGSSTGTTSGSSRFLTEGTA